MASYRGIARGIPCATLLVCLTFAAAPAHAQEPTGAEGDATPASGSEPTEEAKAEAKQRFARGIELFQEGEYPLALIEFERVYELVPDYRVLYNIGQVSIQLGRYARATKALEKYLEQGGDQIADDRKKAVEADLEMLRGRTAFLSVQTNVDGADVSLDDTLVGVTPLKEPILVDAGEHRLILRKPGYLTRPTQVALAGGETANVEITLTQEPVRNPDRVIVERDRAPGPAPNRTAMWVGWTTTGVLAVGTAVVGALAINAANNYKDTLKSPTTSDELNDQHDRARMLITAADVLGAATLIAGGVSIYLTVTSDKASDTRRTGSVRGHVGPGSLFVSGSF
jgi:tetratricopeptide (TPR) repeat protein